MPQVLVFSPEEVERHWQARLTRLVPRPKAPAVPRCITRDERRKEAEAGSGDRAALMRDASGNRVGD